MSIYPKIAPRIALRKKAKAMEYSLLHNVENRSKLMRINLNKK